jgi:hypothetical protein
MIVRIEVFPDSCWDEDRKKFGVQRRRWWGWQTIYSSNHISYCEAFIKDLKKIRSVQYLNGLV